VIKGTTFAAAMQLSTLRHPDYCRSGDHKQAQNLLSSHVLAGFAVAG